MQLEDIVDANHIVGQGPVSLLTSVYDLYFSFRSALQKTLATYSVVWRLLKEYGIMYCKCKHHFRPMQYILTI